jgi:hypothetical protein
LLARTRPWRQPRISLPLPRHTTSRVGAVVLSGESGVGVKYMLPEQIESVEKTPRRGGFWWQAKKRRWKLGSEMSWCHRLQTREAWPREDGDGRKSRTWVRRSSLSRGVPEMGK